MKKLLLGNMNSYLLYFTTQRYNIYFILPNYILYILSRKIDIIQKIPSVSQRQVSHIH